MSVCGLTTPVSELVRDQCAKLSFMKSRIFIALVRRLPLSYGVILCNFQAFLRRIPIRYRVQNNLLSVVSGEETHFVASPKMGLEFFANGIEFRKRWIIDDYMVSELLEEENLVVVDVGANSGDFLLAFGPKSSHYLAVEPVKEEFLALKRNASSYKTKFQGVQCAAGDESGEASMFISRSWADSSLIMPASGFSEKRIVPVRRVDDLVETFELENAFGPYVDLLKIEAEGYEPEVINGSLNTLSRTRYVAIDGGPERGPSRESTIEECSNVLSRHGFILVKLNLSSRPGVALFKNSTLEGVSRW